MTRNYWFLIALLIIALAVFAGMQRRSAGAGAADCSGTWHLTESRTDALADGTALQPGAADTTLLGFSLTNPCDDARVMRMTVSATSSATSRRFSSLRLYGDGVELAKVALPYPTTTPITFAFSNPVVVPHGATRSYQLRGDVSTSTETATVQMLLMDIAVEQPVGGTIEVFRSVNDALLDWSNPEPSALFR